MIESVEAPEEPSGPPHRISALLPAWTTARTSLRVLVVIHSVTAATRIMDVLPALSCDTRLHLFCVRTQDAVFHAGVEEFMRAHGFAMLDWEQALRLDFELAIAASLGDELHEITAPILRLPHGNGYNKVMNPESGIRNPESGSSVFGLSAEWLCHKGELIPAAIALSHSEQRGRLAAGCPEALPLAFVAGDPCHDRLLASAPRRLHYRRSFRLHPRQKLLVVNSTWKDDSLFGLHPELVPRLLAELPLDEFRVALVLHPNVWATHSERQIEDWLADARRSGLILVPPSEGWRAAVIAADHVASDHGSVGMYAAAAGRPVLLDAGGRDSVDPASGLGRLMDAATALDPLSPIRPQLAAAERVRVRTTEVATRWVSSEPGRSLRLIRESVYRILGAKPPAADPVVLAVPEPDIDVAPAASMRTAVSEGDGPCDLRVLRRPAAVRQSAGDPAAHTGVLVVSDDERDHRLAGMADIMRGVRHELPCSADEWSASVFEHRAGVQLTVVHDEVRATLRARDGARVTFELGTLPHPEDAELVASVLAERALTALHEGLAESAAAIAALSPLTIRTGPDRAVTAHVHLADSGP